MFKNTILGLATIAAISIGGAATAATIDVSAQNNSNFFAKGNGNKDWSIAGNYKFGSTTVDSYQIGVVRLTGEDGAGVSTDFLAATVNPMNALNLPSEYNMENTFTDLVSARLSALASNAWSLVANKKTSAAFQMAVWEIVNETNDAKGLDINNGVFRVKGTDADTKNAKSQAKVWLDNISNGTWVDSSSFMFATALRSDTLITDTRMATAAANNTLSAVPVPASGLLLIGGLFGAGFVARRRKS